MSEHVVDRFLALASKRGAPVCVGLDPVLEKLPEPTLGHGGRPESMTEAEAVEAMTRFSMGVLDAVTEYVPCVKPQSACFERYGARGVAAYRQVIDEARKRGLFVVADIKRGDIGVSAAHYAAGCLADGDQLGPDMVTLSAYMGPDTLEPFVEVSNTQHKGFFALVRTSNPGADALQTLKLADGRTVAEATADMVAELGKDHVGDRGYSVAGAVVGATKVADIAAMREHMPQQLFLVPGYGAQGGGADDVKACFKADGTGAIITASRSVIYAHAKRPGVAWQDAVRDAAMELRDDIAGILS